MWDLEKQGLEAAVADLWVGFSGEERYEEEENVGGDAYLTLGGVVETLEFLERQEAAVARQAAEARRVTA